MQNKIRHFDIINLSYLIIIALILIMASGCKQIPNKDKIVYLIDINILNKTDYKIEKLALYEKGENWEYLITEAKEDQNGLVHFSISYNKNSAFYLSGLINNKKIEPFDFTLDGFDQTNAPQTLYISLVNLGNGEIQFEKNKK